MSAESPRSARPDALLAALVLGLTALYLFRLPHSLGRADEAFFLYQAKRIRDGEVMYRDFFQFAAPGAWYAIALLFRLFGTTMATARLGMATLHGLTGITLYATCRLLGVRRALALTVPLAYLALCQAAWPIASPHWFATFLVAALLLLWVRAEHPLSAKAALGLGAILGLLTLVHQHKGLVIAGGLVTLLAADQAIARRHRIPAPRFALQAAALFAGALLVLGPSIAVFVPVVGTNRLVEELVVYPMHDYRTGVRRVPWANLGFARNFAEYTWVAALRYAPAAFVPAIVRAAGGFARGSDRRELSSLVGMIGLFAFSVASIAYYADFIHVAFIAPLALVAFAESVEWALRWLRPVRVGRFAGVAVAVVLAVVLARQLADTAALRHQQYPVSHETAFGRIDFSAPWEVVVTDALRAALAATGSREVFCYPMLASPYLTVGGKNPTPFEVLSPTLSGAQVDEALAIVKTQRVPYIVAGLLMAPDDPIRELLATEYAPLPQLDSRTLGAIPGYLAYARKDLLARLPVTAP